ncbi:DgyrCDS384 [Dimorphilus gyrociliatus]|uniref:DgyrCDS384 n=1 Tax=Dimorphilus gyrociliatus TaxID=2664684 RepID=A0A7I8V4H5_9ANNE|nr:DgyrCDS384 [Dimorphilus gyrociliatus]
MKMTLIIKLKSSKIYREKIINKLSYNFSLITLNFNFNKNNELQSKPEQRKASQTVQKQSLKTSCNSTNGSCEDGECCDDESGGGCCPKDYVVCCADGSNCCPGRAPICCGGILSKSYCCDDEAFCCLGGCCFNENPDNMKKSNILSVNRINPKESLKERNVPVKIGEKKD